MVAILSSGSKMEKRRRGEKELALTLIVIKVIMRQDRLLLTVQVKSI